MDVGIILCSICVCMWCVYIMYGRYTNVYPSVYPSMHVCFVCILWVYAGYVSVYLYYVWILYILCRCIQYMSICLSIHPFICAVCVYYVCILGMYLGVIQYVCCVCIQCMHNIYGIYNVICICLSVCPSIHPSIHPCLCAFCVYSICILCMYLGITLCVYIIYAALKIKTGQWSLVVVTAFKTAKKLCWMVIHHGFQYLNITTTS